MAELVIKGDRVSLTDERVAFTPRIGNYVTFMGELESGEWLVAGNLDSQHEYGMDVYKLDADKRRAENLTNTPKHWEEDVSIGPGGALVYMSNRDSRHKLDFNNASWPSQKIQRDYYRMRADGSQHERLTYFNDPSAPEFAGGDALVAASDFSPDGRYLADIYGVDSGTRRCKVDLGIVLIEFDRPQ